MDTAIEAKELVFKTENTSLYLNDKDSSFLLNTHQNTISFNLCSLIVFKRKVDDIDIVEILNDHSTPDVEIVSMLNCDRMIVLDIRQILELRELLAGGFVMLELNSIIHRELIRPNVF